MKKRIAILGSTGSVGVQALEVISKLSDKFEITALSGGSNIELLKKQAAKFRPKYICIKEERNKEFFNELNAEVLFGEEGLKTAAALDETDLVLIAVSGITGLAPAIEALKHKKNIALANKETPVTAGSIIMKLASENSVKILPVDSEHSAIFQCLQGNDKYLKNLILTASGGPFLTLEKEKLENVSISDVLNHPKWKMGRKITVDSASLMNKGLEVIEAHHLFNADYDNIKIVIHPQSCIHSAAEFIDGSIIAQTGVPSMHIPIQYALSYPERFEGIKSGSFDFAKAGRFDFFEPDYDKFPALKLAYKAGRTGGTAPAVLNAANEEAVYSFLAGRIKFADIYRITKRMLDESTVIKNPSIADILETDKEIRIKTRKAIDRELL